ncbi:MAG: hypothetical protein J7L75_04805 [Thermoproteales archaeon]|nr:hypothetical protein [Thermoproteales archaeon]
MSGQAEDVSAFKRDGAVMSEDGWRRLYVFVDRSGGVYALIAVEQHLMSSRLSWVKHFKKLRRREKRGYVRAFPHRFLRSRACWPTFGCLGG